MRHIFSLYPGGPAGAGLLMLRLHVVLLLVDLAAAQVLPVALAISVLIPALALGLYTRIALSLAIAVFGASLFTSTHLAPVPFASELFSLIALGLLGPGALSIDAHRFGRRVIRLP